MSDNLAIARNATFLPAFQAADMTPLQLVEMLARIAAESAALPGFDLQWTADKAAAMNILRSPGKGPMAIFWWQGLEPADPTYGVYDWVFNADIQTQDMAQGISPAAADQGAFSAVLQRAVMDMECYLRRIRLFSSNLEPVGFKARTSSWIIDETTLLGHRLPFTLRVAAAHTNSIIKVDPVAWMNNQTNP